MPPCYHLKKYPVLIVGIFSDGTFRLGRSIPGVLVCVAQNGTVGCKKSFLAGYH